MSTLIRDLNDRCRQDPINSGCIPVLTQGVACLEPKDLQAVLRAVRQFSEFTPDNDPHGEHDFGAFDHDGVKYFWKIDYYDLKMEMHSPDPGDPTATRRVLTIMRSDEY